MHTVVTSILIVAWRYTPSFPETSTDQKLNTELRDYCRVVVVGVPIPSIECVMIEYWRRPPSRDPWTISSARVFFRRERGQEKDHSLILGLR